MLFSEQALGILLPRAALIFDSMIAAVVENVGRQNFDEQKAFERLWRDRVIALRVRDHLEPIACMCSALGQEKGKLDFSTVDNTC